MSTSPTILAALEDLTDDALWGPLEGDGPAVAALESARRTVENTLSNLDLFEQEIPIRLRLAEISEEESLKQTLAYITRKRSALKFLRLIENRQSTMRGATVKQLRHAITAHQHEAEQAGDQPTEYDLELWEQVAA